MLKLFVATLTIAFFFACFSNSANALIRENSDGSLSYIAQVDNTPVTVRAKTPGEQIMAVLFVIFVGWWASW